MLLTAYMRSYAHICAQLKGGISGARSTDANQLKMHTAEYVPLDPKVEKVVLTFGRSKMDRGFNHPKLGHLLVPVHLLEEYDRNHNEYVILRWFLNIDPLFHRVINRIENGEYCVTALQFPAFLYEEGSYNPDDLLHGLFRGHFLIRVRPSHITDKPFYSDLFTVLH